MPPSVHLYFWIDKRYVDTILIELIASPILNFSKTGQTEIIIYCIFVVYSADFQPIFLPLQSYNDGSN